MSAQLKIEAQVTVDAGQATAALGAVTASSAAVAAGMRGTGAAANDASTGLTEHTSASRAVAAASADAATKLQAATAALREEAAANAEAVAAYKDYSSAQRAAAQAEEALTAARRAGTDAANFSRTSNLELLHIGKSLFDEIAAGASPFRALAVEGGRIGEVIAGSGGVSKAFGGLISLLGGPFVVAGAAAVAVIGGIAYAFDKGSSSASRFEASLAATGNAAALTRDRFADIVSTIGEVAHVGEGEAKSLADVFVASGARSGAQIAELGAVTVRFAEETGQSTDKVAAYFAKAQTAPGEFAAKFIQSYAGISAAQVRQIRELEDQGHAAQAAQLLAKDLFDYYGNKAPAQLGLLSRALHQVTGDFAQGFDEISHFFAASTLLEQRAAAAAAVTYDRKVGYNDSDDVAKLAAIDKQIAAQRASADATARNTAVQRDGATAAAELETKYAKIGDSARRADADVAKFRATVKAALAADPNNATALDLQRRAPAIEKDIREKDQPEATAADKKAATAAAEAEKQRTKKLADLAETIRLIEGEAIAAATVKETREGELKVLELRKQYGDLFTAAQAEQVRQAFDLKTFYGDMLKVLQEAAKIELPDPTAVFAAQRTEAKAFEQKRTTGVEDPQSLDDVAANAGKSFDDAFDAKAGHKFGESAAQQFQSTASRVGELIGDAFGGKVGGTLSKLVTGLAKGSASDPGGLSAFGQDFQAGFKDFNKQTAQTLGDLFTDVFGSKGSDFGKSVGTAFAGASTGQLAGSIVGALGVKTSNAGSELGGALGGLAFGPLGSIIGGVAGGILGGLFGKKATSNSDVLTNAIQGTATGSNTIQQTAATGLGSQVTNGLQQIASALGGVTESFAPITIGQRNDNYRVDTTGATIGKYNGKDFGTGDAAAAAAVSYAVSVALQRGAVGGLSPEVQKVIAQYGDDLNTAVAEAIKVKNLQDTIADSLNPYATAFQTFELQAQQRVAVATQYGFDVVQIEQINATQRAKLIQDTLTQATSSVQAAIDDLKYGSRATGSIVEQRAALTAEQTRLQGLVAGGDQTQLGALTTIVQQEVDLDKQAYGSTAAYATSRDDAVALLNGLVQQASDQITAASASAQAGTTDTTPAVDPTVAALGTLNATGDDQVSLLQEATGLLGTIAGALTAGASTGSGSGSSKLSDGYARVAVS